MASSAETRSDLCVPDFPFFFPTSSPQCPLCFPISQIEDPTTRPGTAPGCSHPNSGAQMVGEEPRSSSLQDPAAARDAVGVGTLAAPPPPAARPAPSHARHVRPGLRPPAALLPLAVREALHLSRRLCRHSGPLFRVSAATTAGDIRGSLTGLAPRHSRSFNLPSAAAPGRGFPAAEPLGASVLALLRSPRVLEKRPRPGNGASRFQR